MPEEQIMFKIWKYRVRDCERYMTGYYDTLEQVQEIFKLDDFLLGLLKHGHSVQCGARKLKIDIRGTYHDNTWNL